MSDTVRIEAPFREEEARALRAGTRVLISGRIIGARDAAHRRLCDLIAAEKPLPVSLADQLVYYVGPAPAKAGHPVGPAGPTTAGRMDALTIPLLERGLRGTIGKGYRSQPVRDALAHFGAVYFGAIGGAAALLSRHILESRVLAFDDLGTEALVELRFDDFPAIVVNDAHGGEAYVRA